MVNDQKIKEIDELIKHKELELKRLDTIQLAIKLIINSIYGAFGNAYFYFRNKEIAASITLQGQNLIKYSRAALNHYFRNKWHLDTELHSKLGLPSESISQINTDLVIYVDTDSSYLNFGAVLNSININLSKKEKLDICVNIVNYRLAEYLDRAFDIYAKDCNTVNQQEFKLETISDAAVWVAKKNYMMRPVYDGEAGIYIEKPTITKKGIDAAKPTYPAYAREKMQIIMDRIIEDGPTIDIEGFVIPKLESFRKAFKLLDIEDCCFNKYVRKYDEWVTTDKTLEIKKGMPIGTRAALYHNYLIEQTNNRKYRKIQQGNKVKVYRCLDNRPGYEGMDIFSYIPNNYPIEFAPRIDYDRQFFDTVVEPINKLLGAMNIQNITQDLKRSIVLQRPKKELKDDQIYPIYALNTQSLEYIEIPKPIDKFIYENKEITAELWPGYLQYASYYGFNTKIISSYELEHAINNELKKRERQDIKKLSRKDLKHNRSLNLSKLELAKNQYNECKNNITNIKNDILISKKQKQHDDVTRLSLDLNKLKLLEKELKDQIKYHESLEKVYVDTLKKIWKTIAKQKEEDGESDNIDNSDSAINEGEDFEDDEEDEEDDEDSDSEHDDSDNEE